jgi:hypothetical protein
MFEKSMNYVNWVLFIAVILATLLVSFRIAQGIITGTVCLGRLCNTQASQPFWYWADLSLYSIGIPVLISAAKRLWNEIRAYKPT